MTEHHVITIRLPDCQKSRGYFSYRPKFPPPELHQDSNPDLPACYAGALPLDHRANSIRPVTQDTNRTRTCLSRSLLWWKTRHHAHPLVFRGLYQCHRNLHRRGVGYLVSSHYGLPLLLWCQLALSIPNDWQTHCMWKAKAYRGGFPRI